MTGYHIRLNFRDLKISFCIVQRFHGVIKPVPAMMRIFYMPVIEKIVMQKSAALWRKAAAKSSRSMLSSIRETPQPGQLSPVTRWKGQGRPRPVRAQKAA